MKKKLSSEIEEKIQALGKSGRKAWIDGHTNEAERFFLGCWEAIPEPKLEYDYAQILSRGLVKFFRDTHQVEKARNWVNVMEKAYGTTKDVDIEFLTATVHYVANDLEKAYEIFYSQYHKYGKRPFEGEDRQYLDFTLERMKGK
ncbi:MULTISPECIES: hypothetical protein [Pseudomonas]|uniref:hypothetical protein n=1 Tax=Pseudomonas TaxID=286 RepID=UPI001C3FAA7E|nr:MULTISPECIES: hypothetical protein [Pseudomonas]WBM31149.1 hypothetical protein M2J80_16400 [Pseudomonas sp. NY11382]